MIRTASHFCQPDRNGFPPLCQFHAIISSIYVVSKNKQPSNPEGIPAALQFKTVSAAYQVHVYYKMKL